jgi:hypothetical protein
VDRLNYIHIQIDPKNINHPILSSYPFFANSIYEKIASKYHSFLPSKARLRKEIVDACTKNPTPKKISESQIDHLFKGLTQEPPLIEKASKSAFKTLFEIDAKSPNSVKWLLTGPRDKNTANKRQLLLLILALAQNGYLTINFDSHVSVSSYFQNRFVDTHNEVIDISRANLTQFNTKRGRYKSLSEYCESHSEETSKRIYDLVSELGRVS